MPCTQKHTWMDANRLAKRRPNRLSPSRRRLGDSDDATLRPRSLASGLAAGGDMEQGSVPSGRSTVF
jgi:hypothetical protein